MKTYVGVSRDSGKRIIFKCDREPTYGEFGRDFSYVIGPFRTMRGARFMRDHGANNPHVQIVADAERLAREVG